MQSTQIWRSESRQPLFRRLMRVLFHGPIKLVVLCALIAWRLRLVAVAIVVIGFFVWILGNGGAMPWSASSSRQDAALQNVRFSTSAEPVVPAPAAEQYLRAQSNFDAKSMWAVVSDEMKRSTTARGGGVTLQRLEQQLSDAKQSGIRYDQATYVGGFLDSGGRGFYLYVVAVSAEGSTNNVAFTFTISKEGKILSID